MIEHEQSITYHRVTLGALTREGDTVAEISGVDGEGIEQTQVIRVPAGLPGERVTIAIEAAKQRRPGKHRRRWRPGPPRAWITEIHEASPLRRQASCPVADEQINRALRVISQVPNERPQVLIRCGSSSGQMLIQPQPGPEVTEQLAANGLDIRSDTLEERLAGETFRIRPSSFFQTNTAQAEKMVQMVVKGLAPAHTVVDAYCGVGTFALVLARHVEKVIAIEESASAIKDAQWNLREVSNVDILKGKVEDVLPTLAEQTDGLVIDPPRAGCQKVVLDALMQHPVARVVYVSCEPATLARDLHILCHLQSAYHLHAVQPLDMFPQTAHIESVAILERT